MIVKCNVDNKKEIFDYIGRDYGKCAYLYIDLKKYGFENESIRIWKQVKDSEEKKIQALVLMYYNGMHIYSKENSLDGEELALLISKKKPALVCGMKDTIDMVKPYVVKNYIPELGKVLRLKEYSGVFNPEVYRADKEELKEIAELLMTDEEMGGPYTFDLLYSQLLERFEEGFGRNWVRRDDKGIVSHCATYAELDDIAVISGGIVRLDYRGKGEYPGQLGAMCRDLSSEGKEVISYYYGGAKTAHKVVGFEILGEWEKLILNEVSHNE